MKKRMLRVLVLVVILATIITTIAFADPIDPPNLTKKPTGGFITGDIDPPNL